MSNLLKQLEAIVQNANLRYSHINQQDKDLITKLEQTQLKAFIALPE